MAFIKFWADVSENLPSTQDREREENCGTLYFVTDTGELYKGSTLIANKTPQALNNEKKLNLYAQDNEFLCFYDGSSEINLKAGAFVQLVEEEEDKTITINSDNTTYDLSSELKPKDKVYNIILKSNNSNAEDDIVSIPAVLKTDSNPNAIVGLVQINPSENTIIAELDGKAKTATGDEDGNNIKDTYATKEELNSVATKEELNSVADRVDSVAESVEVLKTALTWQSGILV